MFNVAINNEQYNEYLAQKEKIKELEARNEFLKTQYDQFNEMHQETLSEKAVLKDENDVYKNEIKELEARNEFLKTQYDQLNEKINALQLIHSSLYDDYQQALSDKTALIKERDRLTNVVHKQGCDIVNLRAKIYDLEGNNKEPVGMIKINPYRDWADVYSPDNNRNINIENLYITNNYFSEEDENDE